MQAYWVIGDIHGEIVLLDRLLEQVDIYGDSPLVFVGDYIDRGAHSREVIQRILSLGERAVCLMGNHELMMLDALDNLGFGYSPVEQWFYNGGEATIMSFGCSSFFSFQSDLDDEYQDFFRQLKMAYAFEPFEGHPVLVVHAGLSPFIPLTDHLGMDNLDDLRNYILREGIEWADSFLWVREAFFNASPDLFEGHVVVHGHTPISKLERYVRANGNRNFIFVDRDLCLRKGEGRLLSVDIDSGSVLSGRLSALGFIPEEDETGKQRIRMRSLTVTTEDVFPRDLGWMDNQDGNA